MSRIHEFINVKSTNMGNPRITNPAIIKAHTVYTCLPKPMQNWCWIHYFIPLLVVLLTWALACVYTHLLRLGREGGPTVRLPCWQFCVTRLFPFHLNSWKNFGYIQAAFHCSRWCWCHCLRAWESGHYFRWGLEGSHQYSKCNTEESISTSLSAEKVHWRVLMHSLHHND